MLFVVIEISEMYRFRLYLCDLSSCKFFFNHYFAVHLVIINICHY